MKPTLAELAAARAAYAKANKQFQQVTEMFRRDPFAFRVCDVTSVAAKLDYTRRQLESIKAACA